MTGASIHLGDALTGDNSHDRQSYLDAKRSKYWVIEKKYQIIEQAEPMVTQGLNIPSWSTLGLSSVYTTNGLKNDDT